LNDEILYSHFNFRIQTLFSRSEISSEIHQFHILLLPRSLIYFREWT